MVVCCAGETTSKNMKVLLHCSALKFTVDRMATVALMLLLGTLIARAGARRRLSDKSTYKSHWEDAVAVSGDFVFLDVSGGAGGAGGSLAACAARCLQHAPLCRGFNHHARHRHCQLVNTSSALLAVTTPPREPDTGIRPYLQQATGYRHYYLQDYY